MKRLSPEQLEVLKLMRHEHYIFNFTYFTLNHHVTSSLTRSHFIILDTDIVVHVSIYPLIVCTSLPGQGRDLPLSNEEQRS